MAGDGGDGGGFGGGPFVPPPSDGGSTEGASAMGEQRMDKVGRAWRMPRWERWLFTGIGAAIALWVLVLIVLAVV